MADHPHPQGVDTRGVDPQDVDPEGTEPRHGDPEGMQLTEESVRVVVEDFYGRVRADPDLAPMFESRLGDRWQEHLERMCDFWTTVLLGTRRYRGNPMASHMTIPDISPSHFTRWMNLFARTARAHLSEPAAADMIGRAERMRWALQRAACDTEPAPDTLLSLATPASQP